MVPPRLQDVLAIVGVYDVVLAVIPLALVVGIAAGANRFLPISTRITTGDFREFVVVGVYDVALAAIPLALALGVVAGSTRFLPMFAGVTAGSIGGLAVVAYCALWNAPVVQSSN